MTGSIADNKHTKFESSVKAVLISPYPLGNIFLYRLLYPPGAQQLITGPAKFHLGIHVLGDWDLSSVAG